MPMHFNVTSPAFENGEPLPNRFTAEGRGEPPQLEWQHAPEGTQSFVLIMEDPDAGGDEAVTHWLVYDIPADAGEIAADHGVGVAGRNDLHYDGYAKPSPKARHRTHRYHFRVFALGVDTLGLPPGAKRAEVERAMEGHVLAEATLMGRYERN
jgi:Raf kinase inhibitor-like YbhB/YbcL family protein